MYYYLKYFKGLSPFIEAGMELDKTTLLHRIEGKVSATVQQLLALLPIYRVGKKEDGSLYLL